MKNLIKMCVLTLTVMVLAGCAQTPVNSLPKWVSNPDRDQAVGSCGTHALGKHFQKECAMARARMELAARQGIQLSATSVINQTANNQRSNSTLNQQIVQEINSKVRARKVDEYHDQAQDIYWVLMEEN